MAAVPRGRRAPAPLAAEPEPAEERETVAKEREAVAEEGEERRVPDDRG